MAAEPRQKMLNKDNSTESVRENYDRIAEEYARQLYDELQHKPMDRELLTKFAEQVRGKGEVCDLGCGPGHVSRYLLDAGVTVFGLDLSPRMVEQARKMNPEIPFRAGDMMALNIKDGSLAGIAAFYAIVNIPAGSLPSVFREMHRVLNAGGQLFLAFHIGDGAAGVDELWGHPISMDFFFFQPRDIKRELELAGFAVEQVVERDPYPEVEYQSRRAFIFARKARVLTTEAQRHGENIQRGSRRISQEE